MVSLLQADDKHLLAGTSETAILFRVGLDGHAEALGDFDAEEVRAIGRSGNSIYVAVNDFEHTAPAITAGPVPARGTRITVSPTNSPASAGALPRPGQRKAKAALYRIDPDGRTEQIFSIGDGYFTALTVDEAGRAFVATGTEGRVYRVDPDRKAALAIDLPERQALTLLRAGKNFLVGTGDVGGLYRVTPAPAKQATYLSRVLDADFHARWGLLRWHGTHELGVATRSGNTAKPDATWSAFSELDHPRTTGDGGVGLVGSPSARYVQYRLTFGGAEAEAHVGEVTLAYLPQNQRARITEITVGDSSGATPLATGGAPNALGGAATAAVTTRSHSPVIKLHWKVDNTDGDDLDLPTLLPWGERRRLAAAGRPRAADPERLRLEHRGPARRVLPGSGGRQRRTLRAPRPRARLGPRLGAHPGRQPQARGGRPGRQVPVRLGAGA